MVELIALALFIAQNAAPMHVTPSSGVCAGIWNTHECAMAIEREQLPRVAGVVSREEEGLCFALAASRTCVANAGGLDPTSYAYLGTLPRPRFHVLWATGTEYHELLLVNARTGTTVTLDDVPVVSPNGETLAVGSLDLIAGWVANRLSVWQVAGDTLELVWSVEPDDWGPGLPVWRDDDTLEVPRLERGDRLALIETGTMILTRVDGAWTMTEK